MIEPVGIERSRLSNSVVWQLKSFKATIALEIWARFREMLHERHERNDREHDVISIRHRQVEASYHEGIRLAFAQRQLSHMKIHDAPRVTHRHLDTPI